MGMAINDAIDRYSHNAEYERTHGNLQGCLEFRQIVDWLKDYKKLKEQEPCEDCVSRKVLKKWLDMNFSFGGTARKLELFDRLDKELPSVKPKGPNTDARDTCKDCKYNIKDGKTTAMCDIGHRFYMREPSTFYCADFEMKGSEDGRHRISY